MIVIVVLIFCLPVWLFTLAAIRARLSVDSTLNSGWKWRLLVAAEIGAAWFLGLMFLCGGMSKLMPFPGVMGPVWLEERLVPYGLGTFARFIAWSEALIGMLLLAKATRVLGAIMMVPLLLNIFMVTVSLNWRGTPWVICFFISVNLFLLAFHLPRWISVLRVRVAPSNIGQRFGSVQSTKGVLLCVALLITAPGTFLIQPQLGAIGAVLGVVGLLWLEIVSRYREKASSD